MEGAVGLVAVLALLMVSYYFLLGQRLGVGHVLDDRGNRLNSADFGGTMAPFLEGLIAVLALSELATAAGGPRSGSLAAGVVVGLIAMAAIIVRQWWLGRLGVELFYSVLGLAAAVPAIARLFGATECDVGDSTLRILALSVLVAIWISTLIAALTVKALAGFRVTASGLALFGAVDVIIVMSGPIGAGFVGPNGAVWIVLGAAVIGGLSGFATNLVIMVSGLFLGLVQLLPISIEPTAHCAPLVAGTPVEMLAGYAVVFWLGAWLISKIRLRRSRIFGAGS